MISHISSFISVQFGQTYLSKITLLHLHMFWCSLSWSSMKLLYLSWVNETFLKMAATACGLTSAVWWYGNAVQKQIILTLKDYVTYDKTMGVNGKPGELGDNSFLHYVIASYFWCVLSAIIVVVSLIFILET